MLDVNVLNGRMILLIYGFHFTTVLDLNIYINNMHFTSDTKHTSMYICLEFKQTPLN